MMQIYKSISLYIFLQTITESTCFFSLPFKCKEGNIMQNNSCLKMTRVSKPSWSNYILLMFHQRNINCALFCWNIRNDYINFVQSIDITKLQTFTVLYKLVLLRCRFLCIFIYKETYNNSTVLLPFLRHDSKTKRIVKTKHTLESMKGFSKYFSFLFLFRALGLFLIMVRYT